MILKTVLALINKTVLALIVAPVMGKPAFVARMIPIFSLKTKFLFEQVQLPIKIVCESNGFDFMVISNNFFPCSMGNFSHYLFIR